LDGIVGAKEVAADAKAAAYEVGILGSSTPSPYKDKFEKKESNVNINENQIRLC
jgi:hypothetical protein